MDFELRHFKSIDLKSKSKSKSKYPNWGGFRLLDLDLRAQIQIFCLDDLKSLRFEFRLNPSRILKAQIHGFQMTS